ncbi:MAG: NAD(P)-dependent oxidoreductase [Acidobacteria bacterium]|nr:NAD(P)-dependent oxidoreductase [Acidobacteriota bacterium]
MAILIIGAGLIGSQIARLEVERGQRPVIFDISPQPDALAAVVDLDTINLVQGDLLNPLDLVNVVRREAVTRIIHTAANPFLTEGAQKNPYASIRLNVLGTVNVLETARLFSIERVVMCSSSVLYHYLRAAQDEGSPMKEEAYPRPSTFYASTKQAAENFGLNYADAFGLDFLAVRFPAVFGPWSGRGGGGPTNRIRAMIERVLRGEESSLPARLTELVYSKDAALGAVQACHEEGLKSRVFNIGMGQIWSGQQVAEMVGEIVPGAQVKIAPDPRGAGPLPLMTQPMDLSRARSELRYQPRFLMRNAIIDYVNFYRGLGKRS